MKLELSIVSDARALDALRGDWLGLLAESEAPAPTLTPDWLSVWWRVFGERRALRVGLIHAGGSLVGLAPFCARRYWYRSCLPFRRLELLGTGEDEGDEICSDDVGVIAQRGLERDVARTVAEGLHDGAFGVWDELFMPAMNGDSVMPELIEQCLSKRGIPTRRETISHAPFIPLPASFDAYLKALTGSHRALVKKTLRELDKWADGSARLECVESADDLASGFEILQRLHGERWNDERLGGVFGSHRFTDFHRRVMPRLFSAGALELMWLSVRGEPVAAQYNVICGDTVFFYQGGRKLDVPRGVRPGTALHAYAIQRAIERGRRTYDFWGGTQRYKLELSLAMRPIVELRAVRPVVIEAARRFAELGVERVRTLRAGFRRLARPAAEIA